MRKNFKKGLSVALAVAMLFSTPVMLDKNVAAAEETTTERTEINKTVGATDCTTAWWTAWSDAFKIDDNKTYTFSFENHGSGANNWNNFCMVFMNSNNPADLPTDTRSEGYVEYAVVRADNWGWGGPDNNTSLSGKVITYANSIMDAGGTWEDWQSIIKDSDVTLKITRSGSELQIVAEIVSQADNTKKIDYKVGLNAGTAEGNAPDPLYMVFAVDNSYINLKSMETTASTTTLPPSEDAPKPVTKKTMIINSVSAKVGAKKITGTVNASNANVEVKVGSAAYKKATVDGTSFTFATAALKPGTKITVKASAEGYTGEPTKTITIKGTMKLSGVKAKKGAKKITGTVSEKKATVTVKVGSKKYKKATVSGKKFTFKTAALKKGTKVTIKVTKKNYKTITKSVKVK